MEYLFLKRRKTTFTSERQKDLLFKAADRQWEAEVEGKTVTMRKVDRKIYKYLLYQLEVRQVFLDTGLSLKKLSALIETNQTYLSNVVNKYFGCNLKELVNSYRVEYAKELLRAEHGPLDEIPLKCGFASKSAFYAAFSKLEGISPMRYVAREKRQNLDTLYIQSN